MRMNQSRVRTLISAITRGTKGTYEIYLSSIIVAACKDYTHHKEMHRMQADIKTAAAYTAMHKLPIKKYVIKVCFVELMKRKHTLIIVRRIIKLQINTKNDILIFQFETVCRETKFKFPAPENRSIFIYSYKMYQSKRL